MAKQMILVVLVLGLATLVNCNMEGDILYKLKVSLLDPNNVLSSWDPTLINPCTWFHITCNFDNSVIRVDLGNAGLSGTLIPELGGLKHLQYLELYANNITGEIPSTFGKLYSLVSLDLANNNLYGRIPRNLAKLKAMKYLRVNGNRLSGSIPREIPDLAITGNLTEMNVADNLLAGTIRSKHKRVTTIIQDPSS